jgi:hypothetical protein
MPQIQDPTAAAARAQEVGVNALKMQEMQRGVESQNKLRELYSQGVDISTPEGFKQVAAIDPATALKLRTDALQGQKLQGDIKKTDVETLGKQMDQFRERTADLISNPSDNNVKAHLEDGILKGLLKPEQAQERWAMVSRMNPEQRKAFFMDQSVKAEVRFKESSTPAIREFEFGKTNPEFAKSQLALKRAGAASTKVVLPEQEKEFEKELGSGQAKSILKSREGADDAAAILQTNEIGRQILNSGAITGAGAEFFVGLNQALKTAGIDFGYADAAANSQAYAAAMGQNTAKLIKQFGAGTGLSDADREYATKIAGGSIKLDDKAIRRILDINDRAARNVINSHNKKVEGIKTNIPLKVDVPGAVVSIKSNAEYNELPPGTVFIDPEGKQRRKP